MIKEKKRKLDVQHSVGRMFTMASLAFALLMTMALHAQPALKVAVMPSYPNQNKAYGNAAVGKPVAVWGRAWGGSGSYTYSLDRGDGSSIPAGTSVSNPSFIGGDHTYTTSGPKTMTLTVTDTVTGEQVSRSATVRVFSDPSHEILRNIAISSGKLWLYKNQLRSGDTAWWNNNRVSNSGEWHLGLLGFSLLAFEENGHKPGNDDESDIYAETTRFALNKILRYSAARTVHGSGNFYDHSDGIAHRNVDYLNGNGYGAYLYAGGHATYAGGICGLALALSVDNAAEAQSTFVSGGPFDGMSIYELIQDIVEQFSFTLGDGGNRGGWIYSVTAANQGRDGSSQQWPCLALRGAMDVVGIHPADWVKENIDVSFQSLQNANGGVGYRSNGSWLNSGKTGGALVAWSLNGRDATYPPVVKAIQYLGNNYYQNGGWNPQPGWGGYFYAMYALKKGISLMGIENIATGPGARNPIDDLCAWLLGITTDPVHAAIAPGQRNSNYGFGQKSDGSWYGSHYYDYIGYAYATANAILILTPGVTAPVPVASIDQFASADSANPEEDLTNDDYDEIKAGLNVAVSGSSSSHTGEPDFILDQYLWILRADDGNGNPVGALDWNNPDYSGVNIVLDRDPSDANVQGLLPGVYHLTLRVRDDSDPVQYDTTTKVFEASNLNLPPVAVPIPPGQLNYTGEFIPGGQVQVPLNGTHSYDIEGDQIVSYLWTGGSFDDPTSATPIITLDTIGATEVSLEVCSQDEFGVVKCSTNPAQILVVVSDFDLFVASVTADNIVQGVSADVTADFSSDLGVALPDVQVSFYDGLPPAYGGSGVALGSVQSVDFTDNGSGQFTASTGVVSLALNGAEEVYVWLDSNQSKPEHDESQQSNVGVVNVSNQPPVINLPGGGVSAFADGSCQGNVSAEALAGDSFDPDGDPLTITLNPAGPYPVGTTIVTVTISDGKESVSDTTTVTITDNVPPSAVAQDLVVQLDASGNASITANQVNNGSGDNCGIESISVSPNAFNCANVGPNTVTFTVLDVNGNVSTTTATVTVEDNVDPIAIAQNVTIQLDVSGNASIAAAQIDNGSNDACGIASMSVIPNSFDCDDIGANTVTLTVTDNNGNTSTVTATVSVEDNVDPIAIAQDVTVQLDASGNGSITAADVNNGSNDACGVTVSVSPSAFTCANVGPNTVTLTVTDSNGNVSIDTATVTVVDSVPPVAIAQGVTVQLDASGNGSISAAQINNGSNDACGIASISVNPSTFNCANVGDNTVILTVTDVNGNVSTATANVVVEDNVAPIAITQDLIGALSVQLDETGTATITAEQVDNGSNDACGIASLSVSPSTFDCSNVGLNTVTLTVTDNNGNVSTATAVVNVEDNIAPDLFIAGVDRDGSAIVLDQDPDNEHTWYGTIYPNSVNVTFTVTGDDACAYTPLVAGFDCWTYNGAGKLIDKKESCVVTIDGNVLTIVDSGGVNDNITFTALVEDASGNQTIETVHILVINPGNGGGKGDSGSSKGNNGVGNGEDPQPAGNPPVNDDTSAGDAPGNPGNKGKKK